MSIFIYFNAGRCLIQSAWCGVHQMLKPRKSIRRQSFNLYRPESQQPSKLCIPSSPLLAQRKLKRSTRLVYYFHVVSFVKWISTSIRQVYYRPTQQILLFTPMPPVSISRKWMLNQIVHLEDLEAGDIQYADEILPLVLGFQSLVDSRDKPHEHLAVDGLGQRSHRVDNLTGDKHSAFSTMRVFGKYI